MVSAILAAPCIRGADVVIATSPLLFTAMAGYVVGRLKRTPFIFELRDLWPESIKAVGAMGDSPVIRFFECIEMFLYRKADLIVALTHSFKERLVERKIPAEKIEIVTNGVDLTRFRPMEKDAELVAELGLDGKFVAGYIGTHGMAHSLETLLNGADMLQGNPNAADIHFLLIGDGAEKQKLVERAKQSALKNVTFIDAVPKSEIARYWSLLDAVIIHLKRTPLFRTVIPSKLFEAMGMGIPVLMGVEGEAARIVEGEQAGLAFVPEDHLMLVDRLPVFEKQPGDP